MIYLKMRAAGKRDGVKRVRVPSPVFAVDKVERWFFCRSKTMWQTAVKKSRLFVNKSLRYYRSLLA